MKDRLSRQSRMILIALSSSRCHLTAEEIVSRVDGVSRATVYRALDQLTERKLIRRLSLGKRSFVYEFLRDGHAHLVCESCGCIIDLSEDFGEIIREAARSGGHEACDVDIVAYGRCSACRERENRQADGAM